VKDRPTRVGCVSIGHGTHTHGRHRPGSSPCPRSVGTPLSVHGRSDYVTSRPGRVLRGLTRPGAGSAGLSSPAEPPRQRAQAAGRRPGPERPLRATSCRRAGACLPPASSERRSTSPGSQRVAAREPSDHSESPPNLRSAPYRIYTPACGPAESRPKPCRPRWSRSVARFPLRLGNTPLGGRPRCSGSICRRDLGSPRRRS
jgi:hypothetical protein